jgi:hypothetical protein
MPALLDGLGLCERGIDFKLLNQVSKMFKFQRALAFCHARRRWTEFVENDADGRRHSVPVAQAPPPSLAVVVVAAAAYCYTSTVDDV